MRSTRTPRTRTVALVAGLLVLAGCSNSISGSVEEQPSPATTEEATTAEPTPEPTPETIAASAGDVVTEEEAQLLAEGLTAYPTEDGTLVVVDVNEPLPEVLVEEANALVIPMDDVYEHWLRTAEGGTTQAWRKYGDIGSKTGRHVVIVSLAGEYDEQGNFTGTHWGAVPSGDAYQANRADENYGAPTLEAAIVKAEEYIATSAYPEAYQIVVVE